MTLKRYVEVSSAEGVSRSPLSDRHSVRLIDRLLVIAS